MKRKIILNVTNHTLTQEQTEEFEQVINLPDDLKKIWATIPPEANCEEVHSYIYKIIDWISETILSYKNMDVYVAVAGDLCATLTLVNLLKSVAETFQDNKIIPIQATTKRESIEETTADGSVVKKSIFKFIKWREL